LNPIGLGTIGSGSITVGHINYSLSFTGSIEEFFGTSGISWNPGANYQVVLIGSTTDPVANKQVPINDRVWSTFSGRFGAAEKVDLGATAIQSLGADSSYSLLTWLGGTSNAVYDVTSIASLGTDPKQVDLKQYAVNAIEGKISDSPPEPPVARERPKRPAIRQYRG
jgi:hypothetical protein